MRTPCFIALTRPVSYAGLPILYVVLGAFVVIGGFVATLSFTYLAVSLVASYVALRALAAYDPRIVDVVFIALSKMPPPPSWFKGRGYIYRA